VTRRSTGRLFWTWLASLAVHGVLFGGGAWVALQTLASQKIEPQQPVEPDATLASITIELPTLASDGPPTDEPPDPTGEPPDPHGGNATPRLDTGAPGAGGDLTAALRAINLSDVDEFMRLSPDVMSRIDRDQLQRLFVARIRQSWEDRRSTPKPTELTFLASGPGTLQQRRPIGADPSRGSLASPAAGILG